VGSSNHRRTPPPHSHQEEASSDDLVEMWVMAPPPPPLICVESSDNSPSDSLGYNDEFPHVKNVSAYELLYFNCLVQLLNIHVHFQIQKLEKKLAVAEKELQ
jgi:hypothetical protein